MWKSLGVVIAGIGVLSATPAFADNSFSGNVALTSDYVFRGISQTHGDPVGHQQVDAAGYFVTPTTSTDNYTTWNVGATAPTASAWTCVIGRQTRTSPILRVRSWRINASC